MSQSRPLEGLRVIELGQLLAGPFAGTVLGYFGAEVIKVEPPTGDPIRQWREVRNGMSLWYHSLARNKKSVTLDLKSERGRALILNRALRSFCFAPASDTRATCRCGPHAIGGWGRP